MKIKRCLWGFERSISVLRISSILVFSYHHLCPAIELIYIFLNHDEPKIIYLWLCGWEREQVQDIKTAIILSALLDVLPNLWTSFPIGENFHYILLWAVADTIFYLQDLKRKGIWQFHESLFTATLRLIDWMINSFT